MDNSIICGIYKIISPSGRVYIGQSKNISIRFKDYYRLKCKTQVKLYNSFKKYGVENHTFEIIEGCAKEDLNCRERYWQDFYDVLNGGLNLKLNNCGEVIQIHSNETLEKLRNNNFKGIIGINNPFSKKCYQYGLDGVFIQEWYCITDIERELRLSNTLIVRCLKGKTRTAHKFQWKYEYEGENIPPIKVKSLPMGTRNLLLVNKMKKLWSQDRSLTCKEISEKLEVKLSTVRNLWQKHKVYISGSSNHKRKNNPSKGCIESLEKANTKLKEIKNGN